MWYICNTNKGLCSADDTSKNENSARCNNIRNIRDWEWSNICKRMPDCPNIDGQSIGTWFRNLSLVSLQLWTMYVFLINIQMDLTTFSHILLPTQWAADNSHRVMLTIRERCDEIVTKIQNFLNGSLIRKTYSMPVCPPLAPNLIIITIVYLVPVVICPGETLLF